MSTSSEVIEEMNIKYQIFKMSIPGIELLPLDKVLELAYIKGWLDASRAIQEQITENFKK